MLFWILLFFIKFSARIISEQIDFDVFETQWMQLPYEHCIQETYFWKLKMERKETDVKSNVNHVLCQLFEFLASHVVAEIETVQFFIVFPFTYQTRVEKNLFYFFLL